MDEISPSSRVESARQRLAAGDIAGARRALEAIVARAASQEERGAAHLVLSACYHKSGSPADALAHVRSAVACAPRNPMAHYGSTPPGARAAACADGAGWADRGLATCAGGTALTGCFSPLPSVVPLPASCEVKPCRREEGNGIALSSKLRREAGGSTSASCTSLSAATLTALAATTSGAGTAEAGTGASTGTAATGWCCTAPTA